MDPLQTAQSLGFTMPGPGYLFASLVFSLVGWGAWRYGKRQQKQMTKWIGVVLMVFPYFITQTWLVWAVGAGLCAAMFFDRG